MAEMAYQRARKEARKLLDAHWDGRLPVDVEQFADAVGADVMRSDLGRKLSGVVSKQKRARAKVVINARHVPQRQRFTLAHEIGHVVERRSLARDDDYSFEDLPRGDGYDLHEFFADEFAGELLMPEHALLHKRFVNYSYPELAAAFDVSIDAMKMRLERLRKHPH